MPPGFPKGQQRFTTAKVIVARSFAPKTGATAPSVRLAFSEDDSTHGTHVAGIAAGNADTAADGRRISGVAPRAYLGNYKVFVETDDGLSPNANSPAIVAAIEAAVADGMDVINFSGGEPEIEPSRDIVALALDAAAAAGVVPVIAAGNDYSDFGAGSVSSPANSAARDRRRRRRDHRDEERARGLLLGRADDDLVAPEAGRRRAGSRRALVGLRWRLGRVLGDEHGVSARRRRSGAPAPAPPGVDGGAAEVGARAVGRRLGRRARTRRRPAIPGWRRGRAATRRSSAPLRRADCGLVRPHGARTGRDADRGPRGRRWRRRDVERRSRRLRASPGGRAVRLTLPPTVTVPGELNVSASVGRGSAPGDLDAYVELRRGADVRRVPVWARVTAGALARHKTLALGQARALPRYARSGKAPS